MLRSGLTKYMNLIRIINFCYWITLLFLRYCKIPKISPRAYIFQRPFLRGLFLEGLIFGGAYLWREICVSKSIGQALQLEVNLPFLLCFTFYLSAIFQVQAPGSLYLEGLFNGGSFCVTSLGGLYMEGLIFGILRYSFGEMISQFFCSLHDLYKMSNQFGLSCSNGFL